MKKLRQGQTRYYIDTKPWLGPKAIPELRKIFLHSHKVQLPQQGQIVERWPVTEINNAVARGFHFFKSRRKAERALKEIARR